MVMVGFQGVHPDDPEPQQIVEHLQTGIMGGVVFFGYNIQNAAQIVELTRFLNKNNAPLLAIDQEGGRVQRLHSGNGFSDFPEPKELASGSYVRMAQEIKQAGFNLNFAPAVDLDGTCPVIGKLGRSFSEDVNQVVDYASLFIGTHRDAGVLTCIKHYPGHGFAGGDSHQGMVDITETFNLVEKEPFNRLITSGVVDMVMTAHLVNRNIDPAFPCTLSRHMIDPWLRQENDYNGVVITDDLHMGAIQQHYDLPEIVIRSIQAGNDILMFSNNPNAAQGVPNFVPDINIAEKVIAIVEKAVDRGDISEKRIDDSYNRIIKLKTNLTQ